MNECLTCNRKTKNPKFCSRSCAAKYSNKHYPKKTKQKYYCKICNIETGYRQQYCEKCNPNIIDWSSITLKDCQEKRQYQGNSRIRTLARKLFCNSLRKQGCPFCGYDKHFEVHHIKSITEFNEDTSIAIINSLNNLIGLCPNHHWEVHNGFISVNDLRSNLV